jgi:phosphopentomutase
MITADHGCDPAYKRTTDHTREYTPFIMYGRNIVPKNYGTRKTFADIAETVLKYLDVPSKLQAESLI